MCCALGSIFEMPSLELDQSEDKVDASNPMLYATQNHFKAVNTLLNDLFAKLARPRPTAKWQRGSSSMPSASIDFR